jgi:O-antigen/teichoic acid export membrane protein
MAQTLGSKVVGMAGQIVLAWLLMPDDMGLWAKASIIMGFSGMIQTAGLRETLIHRQRNYHLWANTAFWMSVVLGLVAGAVTAAAAWPAAYLFHEPRLVGMLLVLAATSPLMSLDLAAEAKLQNQMRFGLLAMTNWGMELLKLALTVGFAAILPSQYKAYSFVLPRPIYAVARLLILWRAAQPPIRSKPQFSRWKYMFNDSATLFISGLFLMLQWQGDYIVLGRIYTGAILGIYYVAFNLSIQTMHLFTGNLTGVLFPALSKLQGDPARQIRAFLDATRMLALIAVPLCMLQIGLADPGIRLFFQDNKWQDAIPVLQALSLGMAFRVVASPGGSLIQAQGRFRVILITNVVNAIVFLSLATVGALVGDPDAASLWLRPATTVGIAVAFYFAVIGPIFLYVAIYPSGGTWRDIGRVYFAPMVAGVIAVACAMFIGSFVPVDRIHSHRWGQAVRLAVILAWFVVMYVPLVRVAAPDAWRALLQRLVTLYRGRVADMQATSAVAEVK